MDFTTHPEAEMASRVAMALQRTAHNRRLLPYVKFHALFDRLVPLSRRYRALEGAINLLGDVTRIDYDVLLACDNGLPGPDFFQRYRKHRFDEFVAVMGDPRFCKQSRKQQRVLADQERGRVYAHAAAVAVLDEQKECA